MLLLKLSASKGRGQAGAASAPSTSAGSTHPEHPAQKRGPSQPTSPSTRPCLLQPIPVILPAMEQLPAALLPAPLPAGSGVPSPSAPAPAGRADSPSRGAGRTSPCLPSPLGIPSRAPQLPPAPGILSPGACPLQPPQPRGSSPPRHGSQGKQPSPASPILAWMQALAFYKENKTLKSVLELDQVSALLAKPGQDV